jgi:cytochrome c oxidase cbb3-type subunit 3
MGEARTNGLGRRALAIAALLTVASLASAAAAEQAAEPGKALATTNCVPSGRLRGDTARGQKLHVTHCAECHGADGKAEVIVLHMDQPPKDQTNAVYMKTLPDAYLYLAICKGGQDIGKNFIMPAFGNILTDQEIRDLVAWVRTFSGT